MGEELVKKESSNRKQKEKRKKREKSFSIIPACCT
jgi:hypothetical protein